MNNHPHATEHFLHTSNEILRNSRIVFRKTKKTQWKSTQFSNFPHKSNVFRCFWSSAGLRTHSNHAEVQKLSNRWFVNTNFNDISVDRGYLGMPLMHQVLRHVMPRGCHGNAAIGRVFCWDNRLLKRVQLSSDFIPEVCRHRCAVALALWFPLFFDFMNSKVSKKHMFLYTFWITKTVWRSIFCTRLMKY